MFQNCYKNYSLIFFILDFAKHYKGKNFTDLILTEYVDIINGQCGYVRRQEKEKQKQKEGKKKNGKEKAKEKRQPKPKTEAQIKRAEKMKKLKTERRNMAAQKTEN